jgi:hypothetical protein
MVQCGKMSAAFLCFCFFKMKIWDKKSRGRYKMIHKFSRLSFQFNISFKCPEFEIERQRAEYISRSWPHGMILQKTEVI